jgi:3-mercaptopyruvate sulfurtransferase SseA
MTVDEISQSAQALPDDELIVLCGAGDGRECRRAYRLLSLSGRAVVCLQGGLAAWVTGGYPTERHFAPLSSPQAAAVAALDS